MSTKHILPSPSETPEERPATPSSDACEAGPLSWVRYASGELREVRFQNALLRIGDTCEVIQVGSEVQG
jgi:hypothetical protein